MASALKMKRGLRNSLCNGIETVASFNSKNGRPSICAPFAVAGRLRGRLRSERREPADEISAATPSLISSHYREDLSPPPREMSQEELSPPPTLEEMLARLDAQEEEEEEEERLLLTGYLPCNCCEGSHGASCCNGGFAPRRMSCVNNSEILRAARRALDQYPRFSVDGIEHALQGPRKSYPDLGRSLCYNRHLEGAKISAKDSGSRTSQGKSLNGNERWRDPGLIARLMGLEAMPLHNNNNNNIIITKTDNRPAQKNRALPRPGMRANISKASAAAPAKPGAKEQPKPDRRRSAVQQPKAVNPNQDLLSQSALPGSVSRQEGLPGSQKPCGHMIQGARPFCGADKTVRSRDWGHGVQRKHIGLLQASSSSSSSSSAAGSQSQKQQRSCGKASGPPAITRMRRTQGD